MSKPFIIAFLALLLLMASYVRVSGGDNYYYSEDEAFHIGLAKGAPLQEVVKFSIYEAHPPLGHIIRHYWLQINDEIWFARSMSLLFGLALILIYYRIGKQLESELTGLCCATLVAFSYCCIVQSYVVRNYIVLLVFISLAFYYYLRWRNNRDDNTLTYYFFFCTLACLTHFAAILTIFVIATYETMVLFLNKKKLALTFRWIGINLVLAVLFMATCSIWHDTLMLAAPYFDARVFAKPSELLVFPALALFYLLLPSKFIIILLLLSLFAVLDHKPFRRQLTLLWVALATALSLSAKAIYPACGDRHDVWLLPFVIPVAGWMVSGFIDAFSIRLARTSPLGVPYIQMILVVTFALAGLVLYNPQARFSDFNEYDKTTAQWHDIKSYLDSLDARNLIVSDKDDVILEKSFYPYLGDDMFSGRVMATLMPYENTFILFNPYYHHMRTRKALLDMMKEAERRHMLDGVDTLVFVRSFPKAYENIDFVKSLPVSELMTCDTLEKYPVVLSDNFKVLRVPKQAFFDQVVSVAGHAHNCLRDYPDMDNFVEPLPAGKKS